MSDTTATTAGTSEIQGPYSALFTFVRTVLAAPTDVVVTYYDPATANDTAQMSVTADVDTGTTSLTVTVSDGTSTLITETDYTAGTLFDASQLVVGTTYTVTVTAFDDTTNTYSSGATVTLVPATLGTPTVTAVANQPDSLVVTFSLVDTANSYTAQVLDATSAALVPPVTAQGTASPISIDATSLVAGTSYQVQVQAALITTAS